MVSTELLDVLFYKNIKDFLHFYKELNKKYYPNNLDEYSKQFNFFLVKQIKIKENFINLIDDYSINGKSDWQEQDAQNCDYLCHNDIINALKNATYESGKERFAMCQEMTEKWAMHLDDYSNAVNFNNNTNILELATGAGLGTCAVIKNLLPDNRLISIDIDFAAAKNADGLAQYLNVADRVCGLNANFWFLPFEPGVFDTVCTHYGLDESREIQIVLKEVSKVLKENGRFVVIARKNPYDRHKNIMKMFDISETECKPLLKKARLYSGYDDLVQLAQNYNLSLIEHKLFEPENGHHRVLYIFKKK